MIRIEFDKLRFLVVDDNPHMRRILRVLLQGFGSREVHEAADGAAALEFGGVVLHSGAIAAYRAAELLT